MFKGIEESRTYNDIKLTLEKLGFTVFLKEIHRNYSLIVLSKNDFNFGHTSEMLKYVDHDKGVEILYLGWHGEYLERYLEEDKYRRR